MSINVAEGDYDLSAGELVALGREVDKTLDGLSPLQIVAYTTRADNESRFIIRAYLIKRPQRQQEVAELLEKNAEMCGALLEDVVV